MKKLIIGLVVIAAATSAFVVPSAKNEVSTETKRVASEIEFVALTYAQAIAKAKETGKLVFIDAYTSWCGPCKRMAATGFKEQNVADLFNSKFINLKVEMEKSEDGPQIAQMFGVRAYPTLLFVNGDGKLVKSVVGYQTGPQLLGIGKSL